MYLYIYVCVCVYNFMWWSCLIQIQLRDRLIHPSVSYLIKDRNGKRDTIDASGVPSKEFEDLIFP